MNTMTEKQQTVLTILVGLSFCHMMNDLIQSLLPAIYPILKEKYALTFTQVGIITLAFQFTASLLQPFVGIVTDKKPMPYSLPVGMTSTLCGLLVLSQASSFGFILLGASLIGCGSSIFHPESSRMARVAAGGRHGFAQSFFQIGGNAGTALGPLLAAYVILPHGQGSLAWFSVAALCGIVILTRIGGWYKTYHLGAARKKASTVSAYSRKVVIRAMIVLMTLVFTKHFYLASMTNYYTFYLIEKFGLSTQQAQFRLFIFLASVAAGTLAGGPIGDRIGRKAVIWVSILGVLPFTLALPYANLLGTEILSVCIGLILSSAFSAIIVYAQELSPGRTGMISGLFFGFAFGMGGLGAAVGGKLIDMHGIVYVYHIASFLPALGILTILLPRKLKNA
ncbi:MAG: MFS transporter [Proteobacteria bacterium]|nr:MFS transporter [Pseudomonadota bacterium]